ncbi:MAG: hypothetical protein ABII22_03650 [Candidatus Micrarchaeota archaeon]
MTRHLALSRFSALKASLPTQHPSYRQAVSQFPKVEQLIDSVYDPRLPSFLKRMEPVSALLDPKNGFSILVHFRGLEAVKAASKALVDHLFSHLHELGYRPLTLVLTPQEHLLAGSSFQDIPESEKYTAMSLIRQQASLSVEEIRTARQLLAIFQATAYCFDADWDSGALDHLSPDGFQIWATLEPIDNRGRTIRDPRIVQLTDNRFELATPEISLCPEHARPQQKD